MTVLNYMREHRLSVPMLDALWTLYSMKPKSQPIYFTSIGIDTAQALGRRELIQPKDNITGWTYIRLSAKGKRVAKETMT